MAMLSRGMRVNQEGPLLLPCFFFVSLALLSQLQRVSGESLTRAADKDAYVQALDGTNFGSATCLRVGGPSGGPGPAATAGTFYAYLQWDLNQYSIPVAATIDSAQIIMTYNNPAGEFDTGVATQVRLVTDNGWNENTISGITAPPATTLLFTKSGNLGDLGPLLETFSVSVIEAALLQDGVFSVRLESTTDVQNCWRSRELTGATAPRLRLEYTVPTTTTTTTTTTTSTTTTTTTTGTTGTTGSVGTTGAGTTGAAGITRAVTSGTLVTTTTGGLDGNATIAVPSPNCSSSKTSFNQSAFVTQLAAELNVDPQDIQIISVVCAGNVYLVTFTIASGLPPNPTASLSSGGSGTTGWSVVEWPGIVSTTSAAAGSRTPSSSNEATLSASGDAPILIAILFVLVGLFFIGSLVALFFLAKRRKMILRGSDSGDARIDTELTARAHATGSGSESAYAALSTFASRPLIARDNVQLESILGSGQFGRVFKAVSGGDVFALKEIALERMSEADHEEVQRESEILARCVHENIVQYLGAVQHSALQIASGADSHALSPRADAMFVAMQLCEFGDLKSLLANTMTSGAPGIEFNASSLVEMARQIASGMSYLAEQGVVHRDLALRNVLVGAVSTGKLQTTPGSNAAACFIGDFGLSRLLGSEYSAYYSRNEGALPIRWLSSEAVLKGRYGTESDVYAFGVTLVELVLGGEQPFKHLTGSEIVSYFQQAEPVRSGIAPQFVLDADPKASLIGPPAAQFSLPTDFWALVSDCCSWDYVRRPSFSQIVARLTRYTTGLYHNTDSLLQRNQADTGSYHNLGATQMATSGAGKYHNTDFSHLSQSSQADTGSYHNLEGTQVATTGAGKYHNTDFSHLSQQGTQVNTGGNGSANASQNAAQPFDDHPYGTLEDAEIRGRRGQ